MSRVRCVLVALVAVFSVVSRSVVAEPAPDDVTVSGVAGMQDGAVARIGGPRWQPVGEAVQLDARFELGLIVSADNESSVRIWSSTSRRVKWQTNTTTQAAAFAFSPDGARIAIGGGVDLEIVDWRANKQVVKITSGGATQLAWALDGALVAYGNAGLHVVDTRGAVVRDIAGVRPLCVAFADKHQLLYANVAGISSVELASPGSTPKAVVAVPRPLRAAAFSSDGARAVWTDGSRAVRVDMTTGAQTEVRGWTGGAIATVAVATSGIVAIYGVKQLALTDAAAAVSWKQDVSRSAGRALAFSADGKHLVYGGGLLRALELGAASGPAVIPDVESSHFVRFTDNETVLVRRGKNQHGELKLSGGAWTTVTPPADPKPAGAPRWADRWQRSSGPAIAWSVDESLACKPMRVWTAGRGVRTFTPGRCSLGDPAVGNEIGPGPWTVQDRFVIASSPPVTVFDATSGKTLGELPAPDEAADAGEYGHHGAEVRSRVAVARDGVHVLAVSNLGISLFTLKRDLVWKVPPLAGDRVVKAATFSPDSRRVVLGLDDGSVVMYETASGAAQPVGGPHGSPIDSITFSPSGAFVAFTDRDDETHILQMPP